MPGHANGLTLEAWDAAGRPYAREVYYSIGGGFVVAEEDLDQTATLAAVASHTPVPYPFQTANEMLRMAAEALPRRHAQLSPAQGLFA